MAGRDLESTIDLVCAVLRREMSRDWKKNGKSIWKNNGLLHAYGKFFDETIKEYDEHEAVVAESPPRKRARPNR